MTFRARLLLAFTLATLVPLGLLAAGVHRQLGERLVRQYERRVERQIRIAEQDLARESAEIAARLATLVAAATSDDRLRLAVLRGPSGERAYVLDWATEAMRLTGLTMLQVQDERGRIISSGHFRNEFDRLEPGLPGRLAAAPQGTALIAARAPTGTFRVLARTDSARIAGRRFDLVGGISVDSAFLERLARGEGATVSLVTSTIAPLDPADHVVDSLPVPMLEPDADGIATAQLVIAHPLAELRALRRSVTVWFVAALAAAALGALALSLWLSARLSRPLAELAQMTGTISLDGPDVAFAVARDDEIGALARRLQALSVRLRSSAAKLRVAERRATVGEMARQVNHDIKNGLIPIRNVLRHLVQVQSADPPSLPGVFAERRQTLESSLEYLDSLARNYARLTPKLAPVPVDVNAVVSEVARSAGDGAAPVQAQLASSPARILADPVVLRRIFENLVRNAVESLEGSERPGRVVVHVEPAGGVVQVRVVDTGRGMSEEVLARAFDDFYTTREGGTGLGLSVVRRLTSDLQGALVISSTPGQGTTVTLRFPAITASTAPARAASTSSRLAHADRTHRR